MLDLRSCYPRQKEGVITRTVGDDTILYDPEVKKVHVVNKTSLLVWTLCTGSFNLELMEREFRAKFAVSENDNVRKDLEDSIVAFHNEGLVVLARQG
ncbi:MAG: hypothetical protein HW412_624 [Bacteroidetes bacterium]|nr:hypothetical protein [Bacteroidota bacterium]